MKKNIVLCGFMGSGKTVTGNLLADKLGLSFIDMDEYIEKQNRMTVNEIFAKYGEAEFRRMETEAAKLLGKGERTVIACGGGAVLNPKNVNFLKVNGDLFYLSVTADTVISRLENDTSRPLLKNDKANSIITLLNSRKEIYSSVADYIIDSNSTKEYAAEQIINIYNSNK